MRKRFDGKQAVTYTGVAEAAPEPATTLVNRTLPTTMLSAPASTKGRCRRLAVAVPSASRPHAWHACRRTDNLASTLGRKPTMVSNASSSTSVFI
jgi:hypothetical protein